MLKFAYDTLAFVDGQSVKAHRVIQKIRSLELEMLGESVCKFNKFGYCKFGNTCFRKHENKKCEKEKCDIMNCSLRHPITCKYFREFKVCKFGEFCKFSHDHIIHKSNSKEVVEMVEKLRTLKQEIWVKDEEIKKLDMKIENMEKSVNDRIIKLEKIVVILRAEVNELKEQNENMRCSPNSEKNEDTEISDKSERDIVEEIDEPTGTVGKEHACEKCPFIGKSESGLKTHNTVKHKVSLMKMYTRKV